MTHDLSYKHKSGLLGFRDFGDVISDYIGHAWYSIAPGIEISQQD